MTVVSEMAVICLQGCITMPTITNIKYFKTPDGLRAWFEKNHNRRQEQWIGYYKKDSGTQSITWPESVDQALCFGWIDGVRKSIDARRYAIRFTPRKQASIWSAINLRRVAELKKLGLMKQPGLEIFEKRNEKKTELYSFEQRKNPEFPVSFLKKFKANKKAWAFFLSQPPWYRRTSTWWVIGAKQESTKSKRLVQLIKDSEAGVSIPLLRWNKKTLTEVKGHGTERQTHRRIHRRIAAVRAADPEPSPRVGARSVSGG